MKKLSEKDQIKLLRAKIETYFLMADTMPVKEKAELAEGILKYTNKLLKG